MTPNLIDDATWALLAPFRPPERGRACRPATGNRQVLEGMFRIARTALHLARSACALWKMEHGLAQVCAMLGRGNFSPAKDAGADGLRAELYLRGTHPIIRWKSNRKQRGTLDRRRYARRSCIERMMGFLKQFRRVATRDDKTAESFLSFVQLAAIHRWMRFAHTAWILRNQSLNRGG